MEESEQAPHPDLESGNEETGEENDPFYKCAFEFAKKHGYGFVEFVEEKVLGKKPTKRVLRKKNQTLLVKKDDRISPVYSVSSSSKKFRIHRDKCVAKPKGAFVGLSHETPAFKFAAHDKKNVKKVYRDVEKIKTRCPPAKAAMTEFVEALSPSRKMASKERFAASVAGAIVSPRRVDKGVDQYHRFSQTSPSSMNDVRRCASGQSHKRNRKAVKRINTMSDVSTSAITEGALNTSKNVRLIAERPDIEKTNILNSQSLDCTTLDNTLHMVNESKCRDSYNCEESKQKSPGANANQRNVIFEDEQISGVVVEEPVQVQKSRTVLPRLKEVTSLEYKLFNSMSATIFRETQLAQKMAATRKHSDKLPLANVDVVHFTYSLVHDEDKNRAPSCEFPSRRKGKVQKVVKSSQGIPSAGSSLSVCGRRKPHDALHVAHSPHGQCHRVESWPSLMAHNPGGLFRSPGAKIPTSRSPPAMSNMLSTVGDSPTKFQFNCDGSGKTLPGYTGVQIQNGINEQGLDLKLPAESNVRDMIFPASVPQVREHCRLRQSVGPYNFEDSDIRDVACSFILYSSKSCKTLTESQLRISNLDKATCAKRSAGSTIRQGSVNNNKCAAYNKDLADVYGECSYVHSSPDSSGAQDANNNAVLQTPEVRIQITCSDDIRVKLGHLLGGECTEAAGETNTVQQRQQIVRSSMVFQLHEQIFRDGQYLLDVCHDNEYNPPAVTRNKCCKRHFFSKKNQQRCNSVNEHKHKKTLANLPGDCKNYCSSYITILRSLKEKKLCNASLPSKSGNFLWKFKQSELDTDWPAESQYITILDSNNNNNNSNNVHKRPPGAHKTTVRHPRRRIRVHRKDTTRLRDKKRRMQCRSRGQGAKKRKYYITNKGLGFKNTKYSITSKGLEVLEKKNDDEGIYSIGPVGYKTLYETLRKRYNALHQWMPPAKCLCRRIAVCCSCNVLENMVDSFRNLITLFPEKRLHTLQKILGLTVRSTQTPLSHSSLESNCCSSPLKLSKDVNTSKSQRNLCKQRPGTIHQSVVPSANTCCNNMINPLSYGYCSTCGRPRVMTAPVESCACQVYNGANKRIHVVDLQPVDSLTLAKERLSKAKDIKDAKRMSKSKNASENACTARASHRGSILPRHVIKDVIATPVIDNGLFCKQQQMTSIFPVTHQHENMDVHSGIPHLECKKLVFKNYLRPSKLSIQSGPIAGNNNHKSKTVKWNISFESDVDAENTDFKHLGSFSRNQEDPDHLSCGASSRGICDFQSCAHRSREIPNGNICGKTIDLRLRSPRDKLHPCGPVLKRHVPESDHLELPTNEDSGSSRKVWWKIPRNVIQISENKIVEGCNKTTTAYGLETEHQNQSTPRELLNTVTRKLVEEFFNGYSPVSKDGTRLDHTENNECLKQDTGNFVINSVQLTQGSSSRTARDLKLPDSEAAISECLHMSNYDNEGSDRTAVISCLSVTPRSDKQHMVNSGSTDISSCNTKGSNNTAAFLLQSVPSGSSVPHRINSGPTNTISCSTHSFSCRPGLFTLPAPLESSLQEVSVNVDEKLNHSTKPCLNIVDVVNEPQFASQTSNPHVQRTSPTDASELSLSSVLTQAYLKVNSPGISTNWVCVLPEMPPRHQCASDSGTDLATCCDNISTLQCALGSEARGSQSSFSVAVVTPNKNYQNQLSSTDEASEAADACDQGSALREPPSSVEETDICDQDSARRESSSTTEEKDVCDARVLNREQISSSSSNNSITSSASDSQCNNNNTIFSLPLPQTQQLRIRGDHLETAWGSSRQQLQKSSIEGRLATMVANKKHYVKMGRSNSGMLLHQNTDNASLFHENKEDLLNGNHEDWHSGNHENLHSGNHDFQLFVDEKSWLAVKHEKTPEVKHENVQAVTSNIVNSEAGKTVSRKRRMNEPLDNMASPPKKRRLNTSLLQPVVPGQTNQKNLTHVRLT